MSGIIVWGRFKSDVSPTHKNQASCTLIVSVRASIPDLIMSSPSDIQNKVAVTKKTSDRCRQTMVFTRISVDNMKSLIEDTLVGLDGFYLFGMKIKIQSINMIKSNFSEI